MPAALGRRLLLMATSVLLAACAGQTGSSTATSPSPSPTPSAIHIDKVDACALVTADEASAATGSQLMNLTAEGGGIQLPGFCFFGASGSSAGVFVYAQVYADASAADAVQPDQVAAIMGGQLGVANAHSVTGIGDRAFEYTATGGAGNGIAIFVFKANVVMMIAIDPTSSPTAVEQLARTAVGRLVAG